MTNIIDMRDRDRKPVNYKPGRENLPFRFVKSLEDAEKLEEWLDDILYTDFRDGLKDRNGRPMFGLKYEKTNAGIIVCSNEHIADRVHDLILDYKVSK